MKLLLIDDEPRLLRSVSKVLKSMGHECSLYINGEWGIDEFRRHRYDAVLTDHRMRNKNAFDVIREIRKHDPGAPVIVISGYAGEEEQEEFLELGAVAFIKKPIDFDRLFQVLREVEEEPKE